VYHVHCVQEVLLCDFFLLSYRSRFCFLLALGSRSNNFVVGLTNTYPLAHAPVLWNYTVCGQYPGAVPSGATVSVHCTNAYQRQLRFRYVVVQFPLTCEQMSFCEVEVLVVGMTLCAYYNRLCSFITATIGILKVNVFAMYNNCMLFT